MNTSSGLWCAECRWKEAAKANAISVVAGWWSVRGPKATIDALRTNFEGGKQLASSNAQMLREVARERYAVRDFVTAAKFARAAESVQPQQENKRLMQELANGGFKAEVPQSQWRFAPFAPPAVFALLVLIILGALIGGDDAAPVAVQQASAIPSASPAPKKKEKTSSDRMRIVTAASAIATGSSQKSAAQRFLDEELAAIRKEIRKRVDNGDEIGSLAIRVRNLAANPKVAPAINSDRMREPWGEFQEVIRVSLQYYRTGPTTTLLKKSAGENYKATVDTAVDAIIADLQGRDTEARGKADEVEARGAGVDMQIRDLRIRAAVIAAWEQTIDACMNMNDNDLSKLQVNPQTQPSR